jgi:hypothetical protein
MRTTQVIEKTGGCSRTRTCDPLIKSQLLYQLSYAPAAEGSIARQDQLVDNGFGSMPLRSRFREDQPPTRDLRGRLIPRFPQSGPKLPTVPRVSWRDEIAAATPKPA